MTILRITDPDFRAGLATLMQTPRQRHYVDFRLYPNRGTSLAGQTDELLVRDSGATDHPGAVGTLRMWTFSDPTGLPPPEVGALLTTSGNWVNIGLGIGVGAAQGQKLSFCSAPADPTLSALETIKIVGPGIATIDVQETTREEEEPATPINWFGASGLYSRIIGTLGLMTFTLLQRCHITIIGAGGMGSMVASALARLMGPLGRILLIDPDKIERANLPNWAPVGLMHGAKLLGRFKVEALAEYLQALPDPPQIETMARDVMDWEAQCALRRSEILISCVDNATARYAISFIASLYHRPLLDIGTAVFLGEGATHHQERMQLATEESAWGRGNSMLSTVCLPPSLLAEGDRRYGADVRLVLPGRTGQAGHCLLCLGGMGDLEQVRRELAVPLVERRALQTSSPFWRQRAGSLFTVNSDATSMAIRQLVELLANNVTATRHWQMDQDATGAPVWRRIAHAPVANCPLCTRAGLGDAAWNERRQVLDEYLALSR